MYWPFERLGSESSSYNIIAKLHSVLPGFVHMSGSTDEVLGFCVGPAFITKMHHVRVSYDCKNWCCLLG